MDLKQQLHQCIFDCQQVVNDLHNMTHKAGDPNLMETLNDSIHHLEMCLRECDYAARKV